MILFADNISENIFIIYVIVIYNVICSCILMILFIIFYKIFSIFYAYFSIFVIMITCFSYCVKLTLICLNSKKSLCINDVD